MKTTTIVRNLAMATLFVVSGLGTASAQHGCGGRSGEGKGMHSEEKIEQRTDRLKTILDLSPEQVEKVKVLEQKHAKEAEAARAKMQEERVKRQQAHAAEMKAILTPEQYVKFEAMHKNHDKKK